MLKIKIASAFAVILLVSAPAHAIYYLGLGAYSPSLMKRTSQESAQKDTYTAFQYAFSYAYSFSLGMDARFLPQLNYTLFPKKSPDGGSEETHLLLELPYVSGFSFTAASTLEWKAGLVLHQHKIKGNGGSTTLNNGGSTSTFYFPDRSSSANTIMGEVGLAYTVEKIFIQGNLFLEAPFNNKRRSFSFLLNVAYKFGEF